MSSEYEEYETPNSELSGYTYVSPPPPPDLTTMPRRYGRLTSSRETLRAVPDEVRELMPPSSVENEVPRFKRIRLQLIFALAGVLLIIVASLIATLVIHQTQSKAARPSGLPPTTEVQNQSKPTIPCPHGMSYCGFQLYNFVSKRTELNNNTLYICHEGSPMVYKECSSTCLHSAATQVATCSPSCQDDQLYCGHELQNSLLNPNTIYECQKGSIVEHERCAHACINTPYASCAKQCDKNTIYCGHELQQMASDFDGLVAQALYWCQSPQKIVFLQNCTYGCTEGEEASECLPNDRPIGDLACGTPHADDVRLLVPEVKAVFVRPRRLWPWLVSLQGRTRFENRTFDVGHFCTGVLLNKQWVLTTAHCVSHIIQSIIIGEYDLWRHDRGQINTTIAREFLHPNYTRVRMITNDIALLKLVQPIRYSRFVKPICLPTQSEVTQVGEKYAIAGWGETYGDLHPHILRSSTLEILNTSVCAKISKRQIFDEKTMICAGQYDESDTVACKGDSGVPLVGRATSGSYVVHGLVSYSKRDVCKLTTNSKMYGVYTKVSAYVQWIEQTIARET